MEEFRTIVYESAGGIAHVSLNRPEVLNAFNVEMRDELYQVLAAIKDDPDVAVAIFTGEGRAFCAGADLTEFGTAPSLAIARRVRWERDIWGAFLDLPIPLIAAVHGYCLGSGLEIALFCDIRIAAGDAVFGMPEAGLGLIPAAGGTQTLPRTLGISKALEMLLTRRRIKASEALELGLVGRVVEREVLGSEAEATARYLVSLDQDALRAVKRAVWEGTDMPLDRALALESRLMVGLASFS